MIDMTCDEIQESISLYVDDGLAVNDRLVCNQHLEVCPVCRAHVAEFRALRSGLAMLAKPVPPADLVPAINSALAAKAGELRAQRQATIMDRVNDFAFKWLQPRPMRYAFSSVASIIIFTAVFAALDAIGFDGWGVVELDSVPDGARTPKESGAIARRYLEAAGRWNDAS